MNQSYRGGRAWIGWITHYRDVCVSVCVGAQVCLYKYISQYISISVDVLLGSYYILGHKQEEDQGAGLNKLLLLLFKHASYL